MPKKAPRFQLANRVVILTFFLSALIVGFYQLTTRGIGVAWMGFIAVLYLLIPPLYRRIFHLKPTYLIDMVLMIFILLAFNLGVALRLYGSIPWYDNAVHGLSGAVFALIGLCVFYVLEEDKGHGPGHNRRTAVGFSFCFAMMTAPVWELIEYAGFLFFGHDAQDIANGVKDSMEDMFFCLVGAMILCVLMAIHLRGPAQALPVRPVGRVLSHQLRTEKRRENRVKKRPSGLDGPLFMSTGRGSGRAGFR